jgi:hypothetical protein
LVLEEESQMFADERKRKEKRSTVSGAPSSSSGVEADIFYDPFFSVKESGRQKYSRDSRRKHHQKKERERISAFDCLKT